MALIENAKDTMNGYPAEAEFVREFVNRLKRGDLDSAIHKAVMHLMDEWQVDGVYTGQSGWGYWNADAWREANENFPCSQNDLLRAQRIFEEMEETV